MRRALAAGCGAALLIIFADRLPAPIAEQNPSPTKPPATPESASPKPKSSHSLDSSSIGRFDGTWRATRSFTNQFGSKFSETITIIIKNGTAEYTREKTEIVAPGKKWADLPPPYNSLSPIYLKSVDKTTNIKAEGSNIRTFWPGFRLIDWTPKTIPISAFKHAVGQPYTTICILSGDQLIVTSGIGAVTYTRVR